MVKKALLSAMALVFGAVLSTAEIIEGDAADQEVRVDGTLRWVGQAEHRIGKVSEHDALESSVFVFKLPERSKSGAVNLRFFVETSGNFQSDFNVDLYGVRFSSSPTVLPEDGYIGPLDPSAALLQKGILSASVPNGSQDGFVTTSAGGRIALLGWLNDLYDNKGAVAGDYIFIRLSADTIPDSVSRNYTVSSANSVVASQRPILQVESAPQ